MGKRFRESCVGLALLVGLVAVAACDCEGETDVEERAEQTDEAAVEQATEPEPEAFGLPLPPERRAVGRTDQRVRVTTDMDLQQLEEFFTAEVVDYEVVRTDRRLRLVPLRSELARMEAYYFAGPDSHVIAVYRPPSPRNYAFYGGPDSQREQRDSTAGDAEDDQRDGADEEVSARRFGVDRQVRPEETRITREGTTAMNLRERRADWLEELHGQPVELRTRDGEKLAPGAYWGEPYTPPEGSPLHQERLRHNFGEPFGDWRPR